MDTRFELHKWSKEDDWRRLDLLFGRPPAPLPQTSCQPSPRDIMAQEAKYITQLCGHVQISTSLVQTCPAHIQKQKEARALIKSMYPDTQGLVPGEPTDNSPRITCNSAIFRNRISWERLRKKMFRVESRNGLDQGWESEC